MHGLINKSIEAFLKRTYENDVWEWVAERADCPVDGFESMTSYDDAVTDAVLARACARLDRDEKSLLEDIGTFLVSHPDLEPVRRLMRFGGPTFADFLLSLDELHDRARLAVPDLTVPEIFLRDIGDGNYLVTTRWSRLGAVALVSGVLNAMAADYGALIVLEPNGATRTPEGIQETLGVFVAEHDFSEGRDFMLGSQVS